MRSSQFISAAVLTAALLGAGTLARATGQVQATSAPDTPTPTQFVYLAQIPSPAELKSRAASQGIAVERIDETQGQTIVVYKYANGTTTTVAYASMPAGDEAAVASAPVPVPATPAPTVAAVAPATTVVYAASPGYYDPYYAGYPYAGYPWGWYAPVAIGFGWGWWGGWHGGEHGWHGGGHGWHGAGHGGWHR